MSQAALDAATADVRRLGVSRSLGTVVPGVNSICAPVFNHQGEMVLAISMMRPGLPADGDPDGATARAARECARRISRRLGYQSDP